MNWIEFMAPALVACVVLAGMHCYLGLHIVARGVFFVDLALAQMAALGAAVGLVMHLDPSSPASYALSIAATLLGSSVFVLSRRLERYVSAEAVIGIVYAVAAAGAVLVMDRAPEGAEELKSLLVGNLLLVSWKAIGAVALLYAVLGALHFAFRRPFLLSSFEPAEAKRQGIRRGLWDFLLYATFGLVVTNSVRMAGVLVVFALLVIPAVVAAAAAAGIRARLLIGWVIGVTVSAGGVLLSYAADLSTGACVTVTLGLAAAVVGFVAAVRLRDRAPA